MVPDDVDVSLLLDPSFRRGIAVAHVERLLGLELHLSDGGRCWVSHERAFDPVMTPCHLRLAMAKAAVGDAPPWMGEIRGWSLGGPFVDQLRQGVVAAAGCDGHRCSFATLATPVRVRDLAAALNPAAVPGADQMTVRASGDPVAGATAVRLCGPDPEALRRGAVVLADACRQVERAATAGIARPSR